MSILGCIVGPTASGKSELALRLAEKIGGEIVSVDSMQLYRGLTIGVAKPTDVERARVPHHLLDTLDLHQRGDIFLYLRQAEAAIADIQARGNIPILCGGTGFYVHSLLYGLDELPGDPALRETLATRYAGEGGLADLRTRMAALDPAALEKLGAAPRKLLRALEVKLLSGKSILELQRGFGAPRFPVRVWSLEWEAAALRQRIAERTEIMLEQGWPAEAERVLAAGLLESPTAHQALGYRQIGDFLAGRLRREQLVPAIVTATWQFARRQRTWFRHQHPEAESVPMPQPLAPLVDRWARELLGAVGE